MSGGLDLAYPERIRQSTIASFDACPLSTRFDLELDLRQSPGDMGVLGAMGVLFHQFAARAMNHMRAYQERSIGVDMAMELLTEVICQRDVPDEDVVHLPMAELRWLRALAVKWSYQQEFSIERVVDVERRLEADIEVYGPGGKRYVRTITGKPDVLLAGPGPDEATLIDWKSGYAPPAARRPVEDGQPPREDKLSDMGYVQQIVYGWLVLMKYPAIQRVTEREFYVRHGEAREATVERWQMEQIQDVLAAKVSQLDAAIEGGVGSKRWFPVPGTHCGFCSMPRRCPIRKQIGIPTTLAEAQRTAGEWHVAEQVRKERAPYLKGWVDAHGPIPIDHAKGRRAVGWAPNKTGNGRSFRMYEPEDAADSPLDPLLEAAAREAGVLVEGGDEQEQGQER